MVFPRQEMRACVDSRPMRSLRVAHAVATFPPYWGGTGNVAFYNARELARLGHDIHVLTAAAPDSGADPTDFAVHRLRPLLRFGNAPLLPDLVRAVRGFDLIHLHWPFIFGAELVWLGCVSANIPYVVTYHHDLRADLRWQFGPYQAAVGPLVLRDAAAVLPVSRDHFATSALRSVVGEAHLLTEIPNGVDVELFHPRNDGESVRKRYGIDAHATVIGYLGAMDRAHAFKGVPTLLRAFAGLAREKVHLLCVGGGDLRADYQNAADEMGLGDRVTWTGRVPGDELAACIAAMDTLVLPSEGFAAESFGIVLIEAMASGKPTIATAIPGVRTVVRDGVTGLLVPPGDAAALRDALRVLVDSPALRRHMGEAGRAVVEREYDWRSIARRLDTVYAAILG